MSPAQDYKQWASLGKAVQLPSRTHEGILWRSAHSRPAAAICRPIGSHSSSWPSRAVNVHRQATFRYLAPFWRPWTGKVGASLHRWLQDGGKGLL